MSEKTSKEKRKKRNQKEKEKEKVNDKEKKEPFSISFEKLNLRVHSFIINHDFPFVKRKKKKGGRGDVPFYNEP